ncbi:DNA repair protein RecN [Pseudomonas aeruginosa]|nr:DNA repair protein RecN [Pseudomonas aeruginosa]
MLVHLSVHNYAIVEHLDLELATGMSVITGETGAGKSIMLDALGLTLGDRADSGAVRPGADKADILASFDVSAIAEARDWLAERDLEQDGPCILRRVITAEGRSRAYINGTPCPLGDLKSLGELLIDIHSQHEHQSLLKSETPPAPARRVRRLPGAGAPGAARRATLEADQPGTRTPVA